MADPYYLSDVTGKSEVISLDNLAKKEGLKSLLPESVREYSNALAALEDEAVHSYLCQLDKTESIGQSNQCKTGKALSDDEKELSRKMSDYYGVLEVIYPFGRTETFYFGSAKSKRVPLPSSRRGIGKNLSRNNLDRALANQTDPNRVGKKLTYKVAKQIKEDRKSDKQQHIDAVEGKDGKSIGQRAILFDNKGKVYRGVNAIRDAGIATELSSKIPSESLNTGKIPDKIITANQAKKTSKHPNKSGIAETTDTLGALAAVGGIAALTAIVAALVPLHFVTSAITFLSSITNTLTNVNNAYNSFLKIADGLLAIVGYKSGTKPLRALIANAIDNAFGKENIQESKNIFASCINSIATATKLLEKIQQGRAATDNKIDETRFALGIVNNALKDSGMLPPDSPYMQQSAAIDEFVKSSSDPDLRENINKLTEEIKTQEETQKTLKEEAEARAKVQERNNKEIDNVLKLVDSTKTNVDKIQDNDL